MRGGRRRQSTLGEVLALLVVPVVWLVRLLVGRKRASPEEIKRFYRSAEWKRLRYAQLSREPCCRLCGASAMSGARMNVGHVRLL